MRVTLGMDPHIPLIPTLTYHHLPFIPSLIPLNSENEEGILSKFKETHELSLDQSI